jgi:hypothetical protein
MATLPSLIYAYEVGVSSEEICKEIANLENLENLESSFDGLTLNTLEKYILVNRGTGAGGFNTNLRGKNFEEKTNNEVKLLFQGYEKVFYASISKKNKYNYYLLKIFDDRKILFFLQNSLKIYIKEKYDIDLFRYPDEAYIIEYNSGKNIIKILEKKSQNGKGSVDTKLWSGPSLKREYEIVLGNNFIVTYGFCVNTYLQKKIISDKNKYSILNKIFIENNIMVLFGDDEEYFLSLDKWINLS